jgi:hypothetical protein
MVVGFKSFGGHGLGFEQAMRWSKSGPRLEEGFVRVFGVRGLCFKSFS